MLYFSLYLVNVYLDSVAVAIPGGIGRDCQQGINMTLLDPGYACNSSIAICDC